jgi:tRNA G10  N-methylase Trm11
MYEYRDLRTRLMAKIKRAYYQHMLPPDWWKRQYRVWRTNSKNLPIDSSTVNAIITSPPYFKALDYARDNRLRLWFLGCKNWEKLEASRTAKTKVYLTQMRSCLQEMYRVLKPKSYCVLVLGDVERHGTIKHTADILAEAATKATHGGFRIESIYDDFIPEERRSRRGTKTTKIERILVMRKR